MAIQSAQTQIILETRTPLQDGRFPLKIRITFDRNSRYYSVLDDEKEKMALSENEFEKVLGKKPRGEYKTVRAYLIQVESRANDIITSLPYFSFDTFRNKFYDENRWNKQDLFSSLQVMIDELRKQKRIGYAKSFENSLSSLKKYTGKKSLLFSEATELKFWEEYEEWIDNPSTTGFYVRNIRTCFNSAISQKIIPEDLYPFSRRKSETNKYQIPTGRNIKKALSLSELKLLFSYPTLEGTSEQQYKDYWFFLYLCNGCYVSDMANLKYNNIREDYIVFHRVKTARRLKSNPILVRVPIEKELGRIIDKWGNKPFTSDDYLFPILNKKMSAEKADAAVSQATKNINKFIDRIAIKIGLKGKIRSAVARHTFASSLKWNGASDEYISESLGHSNVLVTKDYLADFEDGKKKEWAKVIEDSIK